jgi:DNA repair photolyase
MMTEPDQSRLPFFEPPPTRRTRLGQSTVSYYAASGLLNTASGFISEYDYTLNPYQGCTFACTYCYAAFFVRDAALRDAWGTWVRVKENALALLRRARKRPLRDKTIYISSVTDPYQPIERELELTRSLLLELLEHHTVRPVIQTRSPLVTRDLDLLARFPAARVNMTITTDDETVRRVFEPACPSVAARLAAITAVAAAGVPACVTLTPLLPIADPVAFAERLLATGARDFVVQAFHAERGKFVAGTREPALQLCAERGWTIDRYHETVAALRARLPNVREGRDGFAPE